MLAQIITENGVKKIQPFTADVGAGAPVGSLAMMYKKSAPSGYLYCDGSAFNAATYPALYAYLGSNTLPDYREFAPVGAEQNATDTIAAHDVYAQGEGKDDQFQSHDHTIQKTGSSAVYTAGTGSGNYAGFAASAGTASNILYAMPNSGRKGDVTRGKRKAVYFYIKATSGLAENQQENVLATINENNSYSTTEQPTGAKWIDGKPIYRKVVDCGALPNNNVKSVAHNITNIDKVVKLYGVTISSNDTFPLPYVTTTALGNCIALSINSANITMRTGTDRTSYTNTYVTIEYTKTTD